jgi:hypothetical protein
MSPNEKPALFGVLNQYAAGLEMNADNTVMTFTREEADEYAKRCNEEDIEAWRAQGWEAKHGPCYQVKPLDENHRIIIEKLKPLKKTKAPTQPVNTLAGWSDIIREQGEKDDVKQARGRIAKHAALGEAKDDIVKAAIALVNSGETVTGTTINDLYETLKKSVKNLEEIIDV